jgi:hypothetical protein
VSGYQSGIAGAFLGDNAASVYSGAPSVISSGSVATANVAGSPYAIDASLSGMTLLNGYAVNFVDAGKLTVAPAHVTVTALGGASTYGGSPSNPGLSAAGLVNGQSVSVLTGLGDDFAILPTTNAGTYALHVTGTNTNGNYVVDNTVNGSWTVDRASLFITADSVVAPSLSDAQFSSSYSGFVNGDDSSVVLGLGYGVFPITGDPLGYDIVPFGASASNYTITYFPGLLTLLPSQSGLFPAPLIGDGGYNGSASFNLSFGPNSFSFSNIATASLGAGDDILLFEAGLPGAIGPFQPVAISDYSNATNAEDQLINCQSESHNGQGTCGASGGTGL